MDHRARFACIACRRLKRKCPKELPSCSLCVRLEKRCEYPPRARNLHENTSHESSTSSERPSWEDDRQLLSHPPTELHSAFRKGAIPGPGDVYAFPAMYFLDSEVCIRPLPSDSAQPIAPISSSISLPSEPVTVYERYFSTIHQWLPVLSKKRVRQHMAEGGLALDSPLHLLFLCMKLVSEPLPLEVSAKTYKPYIWVLETLLEVENSRLPCLQLLQSVILISIYEMSHAIYPAAYLRVGHASRLCIMMGFHDRKHATQLFKDPVTWTAREEERRAWWAVFCLDRITSQGVVGFPLSTPEASSGELLPCPEAPWNEGGVGFNEPLFAASFSNNTSLGSFANVCQAAHVLGRVLRHRSDLHNSSLDLGFRISEAKQLHQILASLSGHLSDVSQGSPSLGGSVSVSLTLCFSARLSLYDIYACNEKYSTDHGRSSEEAEMQREALVGIFEVVEHIWQLARQILDSIQQGGEAELNTLSPLLCHCLYAAAGESEWLLLEQENSSAGQWLKDIVKLLELIGERWQIAGVYLSEIYTWPGYQSCIRV
ncbi:hypothetical protein F5Y06DRAFT_297839 [Hypoxylon sp. FL0890]|nr:hypothetical protein F5Y06DRAFT_297839 [Hypoxylon sp. FL0890]